MKIEVPISEDSQEYARKVLSQYEEVTEPIKEIESRCVLHLYPNHDTMIDEIDEITGYIDALFCELHVYDVQNRKVYKHKYCDGVITNGVLNQSTRIFKDLSTMIIIEEPVKISYYTAVEVESPKYLDMIFKEYE